MIRLTLLAAALVGLGTAARPPAKCAVGRVELTPEIVTANPGDVDTLTATVYSTCGAINTITSVGFTKGAATVDLATSGARKVIVTSVASDTVYVYVTASSKKDSTLFQITAVSDTVTPPGPDTLPGDTTIGDLTGVRAAQADSFVSSLGLSTHVSYTGGVYGTKWATVIRPKLLELGIRNIREEMVTNSTVVARIRDLANEGIRLTGGCWPKKNSSGVYVTSDASHCIWMANAYGTAVISAFDGWNEPDGLGCKGCADWATKWVQWQTTFWNAVHASGTWNSKKMLGNSLAHANDADAVGLHSSILDFGNLHSYPCGVNAQCMPSNVSNSWIPQWNKIDGGKPDYVTETGFHTCIPCGGMSFTAQGKLTGRLWFEYWNRGIIRTHFYELIDQHVDMTTREANWGILTNAGTAKPSFTTTKNIIALLKDPGSSFTPGLLNFSLSGGPSSVHRTLVQKRNGHFFIAIWNEIPVWNPTSKTDISNSNVSVTLTLGSSKTIKVYNPGASTTALSTTTGTSTVLSVPDEVRLVEIY